MLKLQVRSSAWRSLLPLGTDFRPECWDVKYKIHSGHFDIRRTWSTTSWVGGPVTLTSILVSSFTNAGLSHRIYSKVISAFKSQKAFQKKYDQKINLIIIGIKESQRDLVPRQVPQMILYHTYVFIHTWKLCMEENKRALVWKEHSVFHNYCLGKMIRAHSHFYDLSATGVTACDWGSLYHRWTVYLWWLLQAKQCFLYHAAGLADLSSQLVQEYIWDWTCQRRNRWTGHEISPSQGRESFNYFCNQYKESIKIHGNAIFARVNNMALCMYILISMISLIKFK